MSILHFPQQIQPESTRIWELVQFYQTQAHLWILLDKRSLMVVGTSKNEFRAVPIIRAVER